MNLIDLKSVQKHGNRIIYDYTVSDDIQKYFQTEITMFVEYDENIESVPLSIAVIPFVVNVLPIIWLTDSVLNVPELDKDFFDSIEEFKNGYIKMYPMLSFQGKLNVGKLHINHSSGKGNPIVFFSGGVDAFATLTAHIDERPILLTLWGADVDVENEEGWSVVWSHTRKVAESLNLESTKVKTTFRKFLNQEALSELVKKSREEWYFGFQHGIGMLGHAAPLTYLKESTTVYIASSYRPEDKIACASDLSIDGNVRYCGAVIFHDQYEYNRQEKIMHLCQYVDKSNHPLFLRVCWTADNGGNCCHCEKCYRTIFALLAEGADPNKFGFNIADEDILRIIKYVKTKMNMSMHVIAFWNEIQSRFLENEVHVNNKAAMEWMKNYNFNKVNSYYRKRLVRLYIKIVYRAKN